MGATIYTTAERYSTLAALLKRFWTSAKISSLVDEMGMPLTEARRQKTCSGVRHLSTLFDGPMSSFQSNSRLIAVQFVRVLFRALFASLQHYGILLLSGAMLKTNHLYNIKTVLSRNWTKEQDCALQGSTRRFFDNFSCVESKCSLSSFCA